MESDLDFRFQRLIDDTLPSVGNIFSALFENPKCHKRQARVPGQKREPARLLLKKEKIHTTM